MDDGNMTQSCCFYKQNPSHSYFSATAYNPQEKRISAAVYAYQQPSLCIYPTRLELLTFLP